MTAFQLKKIAFTLSLSAALTAHAAGLGTMTSSSKLGEPLNAEIELLAVTPNELNGIQAALASEQVYQDQLLEKPASYPYIKIEVANSSKGLPVLKLSSSQPITEAFLDMLIQVDWPTGRLVKEYTLLLDPPGFQSNYASEPIALPAAPANNTAAPMNNQAEPAASAPAKKANDRKSPDSAPVKAENKPAEIAAADHETERGDTLYAIARQMRPDNVSVEQMLAGLYQANPKAFAGNNMNRLKVGKILRMPDQATLNRISQQQAKTLVAAQTADWQAYKNSLAKVVQQSPESKAASNSQQSAGKIGAAQDKPLPATKAAKDVLKLSAGDEKSSAQADKSAQKAMEDKLNALQEDLTAKDSAMKEEKSRTADLEKQIADMKKLLAMKSDAMAKMQQDAAQVQKPAVPVEAAPQTVPEAAASAPQAALPELPAAAVDAAGKEGGETAPAVVEATPEQPVEHPSFILSLIQRLKQMNPALPFALVALPLLGCAWLIMRVRRKKQMHTFEEAIVTSPATEFQNNTVFGNTQMASGDTSFLTDFSQSAVGGMIDAHDVDPIAEAEVYMAYGRDAQAEEILKDAIQKDPNRQELKLKLLEIYHGAENMAAFETLASELYAKAGPNDPAWSRVVSMGQKLDPNNPLYRAPAQTAAASMATSMDSTPAETSDITAEEEGYHLNFEAPSLEFESSASASDSITASPFVATDIVAPEAESANTQTAAETVAGINDTLAPASVFEEPDAPVMGSVGLSQADQSTEASGMESAGMGSAELEDDSASVEPVAARDADSDLTETSFAGNAIAENPAQPTVWGDGLSSGLASLQVDTQAAANPEVELTPKSLDLPTLDFDVAESEDTNPVLSSLNMAGESNLSPNDAVFESLPDLSFELGTASEAATTEDASASNGMMLEEISLEAAEQQMEAAALNNTPEVEAFPEISLDVAPVAAAADTVVAESESEEVDTKLDLIKAYIDMEDVIGAKELIEEVLQEGGENQRKRAGELLAQLA